MLFVTGLLLAIGCSSPEPPADALVVDAETTAFLRQLERLRIEQRTDEGLSLAREYLEEHPDAPRAHYGLAVMLGADDDHRAAIAEFEKELVLDPAHFGSHRGLGTAYSRLGELERAIAHLERCLELRPGEPEISFQLGRNLSTLGRFERAEPLLLHAATHRKNGDSYAELGTLYRRTGRHGQAERVFRTGLEVEPDHLGSLFNLGQTLLQLGRTDEAQALLRHHERLATLADRYDHYERSSRLPSATPAYFLRLGELQLKRHETDAAIASYLRAVDLDPDSATAALALGSIYL